MICAICYVVSPNGSEAKETPAEMVVNGHSVCSMHLGEAACGNFNDAISSATMLVEQRSG